MYLAAEVHLNNDFLKAFRKGQGEASAKRVQEFVMQSFKMNQDNIEVIDTVSTSAPQPASSDAPSTAPFTSKDDLVSQLIEGIENLEKYRTGK